MEIVRGSPRIVLDGAHTPESIHCLMRAIGAHIRYDSMVVVFGCAADKDARRMLEKVATGADKVIFTKAAGSARAMDPRELARRFGEISSKMAQVARTLPDALSLARRAVQRDDLICVTGSFYLAGEAKKHLAESGRPDAPSRAAR
jgi:dihydrofolate synthase/folylpolyglutamate synthase